MMAIRDNRGWILKTKLLLPERLWRMITRPAAMLLRSLPESVNYKVGMKFRRSNMPYSLIEKDDIVFQIGAPADLLSVGRSRSAYFMHLVSGSGKLIVMEPDSENCEKMQAFANRNGLANQVHIVNAGAWSDNKELLFYESKEHPASAVLKELCEATPEEMKRRGYHEVPVPVRTVDSVLDELSLKPPKLVSITTNGAEIEILKGMKDTFSKGGGTYISLAITGDGYSQKMSELGFERIADDDRGFTFKKV